MNQVFDSSNLMQKDDLENVRIKLIIKKMLLIILLKLFYIAVFKLLAII